MDNLIIDEAGPADLAEILALMVQLTPNNAAISPAEAEAVWARMMATDGLTVLAARRDGRIIATATLVLTPNLTRGGRSFALVENVVTDQAYRQQGVGRAVLAEAFERAWSAGCYKVMLSTGRPETQAFYESAGFTVSSKTFFEARRL